MRWEKESHSSSLRPFSFRVFKNTAQKKSGISVAFEGQKEREDMLLQRAF